MLSFLIASTPIPQFHLMNPFPCLIHAFLHSNFNPISAPSLVSSCIAHFIHTPFVSPVSNIRGITFCWLLVPSHPPIVSVSPHPFPSDILAFLRSCVHPITASLSLYFAFFTCLTLNRHYESQPHHIQRFRLYCHVCHLLPS